MRRIKRLLQKCFRNAFFLVRVEGESMWPRLVPGRRYFASNLFPPCVGDIAVFRNPKDTNQIFVKKVAGREGDRYIMEGEVSWGSSSCDFGPVSKGLILGKIIK